jgi:hypothetical protein
MAGQQPADGDALTLWFNPPGDGPGGRQALTRERVVADTGHRDQGETARVPARPARQPLPALAACGVHAWGGDRDQRDRWPQARNGGHAA